MPAPKHSEFYRGFFEQLGNQSSNQAAIALTPDHQNTLLGMLADYKKLETFLAEHVLYRKNNDAHLREASAMLTDIRTRQKQRE